MSKESFLEIDIHQLHLDWCHQPKLLYEHAMKLADARMRHAEAKVELELIEAETDAEIRKRPFAYDLEKVTEAVVRNTVIQQKNVKEAQAALIAAKHAVDVLEAAVSALDHKKKALENMVQLRLNELYAEPKMPRGSDVDPKTSHAFDKRR